MATLISMPIIGPDPSRTDTAKCTPGDLIPLLIVVAVALVDIEQRVLLQQRPHGKSMAGLWELPGGKLVEGESPELALIRELKEELGIDVTRSCLAPLTFASHSYVDFQLLMLLGIKWGMNIQNFLSILNLI